MVILVGVCQRRYMIRRLRSARGIQQSCQIQFVQVLGRRGQLVADRRLIFGRFSAGIHRVLRIDGGAEVRRLLPVFALALGQAVELARHAFKCASVLALRINFKQLDAHRITFRLGPQRLFQNLFRLRVTSVRDIDIGFGDRIDFICIELACRRSKVRIENAVIGIDALPTC